ncbi:hypothetical protein VM1G_08167 [Cytospora mali]|uniref:Myb-like domain-containing protein n=1 Tax=Cytospora mali TaxID=578113 RepID=A0A194W9K2_CYTMA|nr:hypothetical protein VM1G_08167 [Valsa mali]
MTPKVRGTRGPPGASAAPGRQSTRIAAQMEAAQHAAGHAAVDITTTTQPVLFADDPPQDSPMPPPSSRGGRGRPRGRGEQYARRGTRRPSQAPSMPASIQSQHETSTIDYLPTQSEPRDPFTPQRVDLTTAYPYSSVEASQPTPRTQDAKANLMNKFVDGLYSASKALSSHLALEDDHSDKTWRDELEAHKDVFYAHYKIYNAKADVFIDIDAVSARTNSEQSPLWPRMTRAVATANLVNLLSDIEDLEAHPIMVLNRLPLLQRIDDSFPVSFLPGGKQGLEGWVFGQDTMDQAFAIRTQRYIETLRGVQKAGTIRLFARVFLDIDVDNMTDDMLGEFVEGAPLKDFYGFDINDAQAQKYRDVIAGFRGMLLEMDSNAIISTLEEEYPFQPFLDNLKDWVKTFEASTQGSDSQVLAFNGDGASAADAQLQQEATQGRFTYAGVERLRQHMAANTNAHQAFDNDGFASQAPSYGALSLDDTDRDVLQRSGGQRARDLSQAAIHGQDGSTYAAAVGDAVRQGRKRGRKSAADEDATTKRTRTAADFSAMPPPARRNPGGDLIPSSSMSSAGDRIDPVALSRQSQLISKANRKPAQPKQRKPWTAHDTRQLIEAVNTYKAKWSTIERAIKENHIQFNVSGRDQQGLRDKARLTKVDMLKTDAPLPPGFDLVVLGRKEKEMVRAVGRNPDRKEEDNDPDNETVHNNIYTEEDPSSDNMEASGPDDDPDAAAKAAEEARVNADFHALHNASLQPEPHMGDGAPTAPMMAPEEETVRAAPSEHLGEVEAQHALSHGLPVSEGSADAMVDEELSEAGPSDAAGTA